MKHTIGIPAYKLGDSGFGVGVDYLKFASRFGDVKIIMPWEEHVKVDLLLLPGGADTAPSNYGEIPDYSTGNADVFKDFFFKERLKNYVGNTSIVGICLGMQQLNVFFGGSLTQDLMFHAQSSGRWQTAHKLYAINEKGEIAAKGGFEVNSHHHQAVTLERLSDELEALYVSDNEDSDITDEGPIVEAFKHKTLPIFAVQWHPEQLYDKFTMKSIKKLLPEYEVQSR